MTLTILNEKSEVNQKLTDAANSFLQFAKDLKSGKFGEELKDKNLISESELQEIEDGLSSQELPKEVLIKKIKAAKRKKIEQELALRLSIIFARIKEKEEKAERGQERKQDLVSTSVNVVKSLIKFFKKRMLKQQQKDREDALSNVFGLSGLLVDLDSAVNNLRSDPKIESDKNNLEIVGDMTRVCMLMRDINEKIPASKLAKMPKKLNNINEKAVMTLANISIIYQFGNTNKMFNLQNKENLHVANKGMGEMLEIHADQNTANEIFDNKFNEVSEKLIQSLSQIDKTPPSGPNDIPITKEALKRKEIENQRFSSYTPPSEDKK